MEAAARPLPKLDTTPPVTKTYFADIDATSFLDCCDWTYLVGTIKYGRVEVRAKGKFSPHLDNASESVRNRLNLSKIENGAPRMRVSPPTFRPAVLAPKPPNSSNEHQNPEG
jgi:hypothetical protein